jgi:putative oxidoreductase
MFKTNRDLGLLILRVGMSAMMLTHGIGKLQDLFTNPADFADPLGLGATVSLVLTVFGEFVAPIFIIIGYKTKIAAIPGLITMLVAAFIVHAKDPIDTKEKAILYAIFFLAIAITGPGKYAIDKN